MVLTDVLGPSAYKFKNVKPQFSKDNKEQKSTGPRPLGPKSTFVPRGEVVSFVPKPDNKKEKKQKNYDVEKKGLKLHM